MSATRSLTFLASPWSIAAGVVVCLVVAAISFISWRRSGYRADIGCLEALRVAIVALATVLLNQPEWIEEYRPDEKPAIAVLWDAHSIPSLVPRFFDGRLPDLNLGSARGASAAGGLVAEVMKTFAAEGAFSSVVDGRFIGGYITRSFGRPQADVHALQLELAQIAYMDEDPPFAYRPEMAQRLQPVLTRLLQAMLDWAAAQPDCRP